MENSFPHRIFCIAYLLCHFCGQLSTEIAESCALRSVRRPPRGQKGRDTCGFPSSLNSCLSLGESGAAYRHVTASKRSTAEDFFLPYLSQPIRSVRYRSATHVISSAQAQHTRVAQFVSLEVTDNTYEDKWYLTPESAGAFRHNAQTSCAARLCRACAE